MKELLLFGDKYIFFQIIKYLQVADYLEKNENNKNKKEREGGRGGGCGGNLWIFVMSKFNDSIISKKKTNFQFHIQTL